MKKVFLFLFGLSAIGCSKPITDKMVVGKYFCNEFHDSILVYTNHTYKHKYIADETHIYETEGKWELKYGVEIYFNDFSTLNIEGSTGQGLWISQVDVQNNGEVRLIYASDSDIYYSNRKTNTY